MEFFAPQWFQLLKTEDCKKLRLIYQHSENKLKVPDFLSAGVIGGGGTWLIESVYSDHSRYWSSNWLYKYPYASDKKIFNVYYRRQFKKHKISPLETSIEKTKKNLGSVLWNISEFAKNQAYEKWVDFFENALSCLYDPNPGANYYYNDIIPIQNYTLSEQQLIFGAGRAWCFGQKGSWNDMNFKDKLSTERHAFLSAQLYDEIINSILAITNK
jgi:hypothetical protein